MKETYNEAIAQVFKDEGGYSNDAADPGGPTNWGITIADARRYWKRTATAEDVKVMPKSVAEDIYRTKYATAVNYDALPPGLDYGVLDYGINSGPARANRVLASLKSTDTVGKIHELYDERLNFLHHLRTFAVFGKGWTRRCTNGRQLALSLYNKYSKPIVIQGHVEDFTWKPGEKIQPTQKEFKMPWFISMFINSSMVGGWVRALVAAALGVLVAKVPFLSALLSPEYQATLAIAAGTTVAGLWSAAVKDGPASAPQQSVSVQVAPASNVPPVSL